MGHGTISTGFFSRGEMDQAINTVWHQAGRHGEDSHLHSWNWFFFFTFDLALLRCKDLLTSSRRWRWRGLVKKDQWVEQVSQADFTGLPVWRAPCQRRLMSEDQDTDVRTCRRINGTDGIPKLSLWLCESHKAVNTLRSWHSWLEVGSGFPLGRCTSPT